MTEGKLRYLVEMQCVECKKSLCEKKEGLESLNGMINANSAVGRVLFGVAPDGSTVGIEPGDIDKAQRSLAQHIRAKFCPAIRFEIETIENDGKQILVVNGKREPDVPLCEYDGRAFIREGSETRQLSLSEKLQIIKHRDRDQHRGPWRCDKCGSLAMEFYGGVFDGQTFKRSYECECGGQYWPAI